jgi:antitoxin ParD1/3/4
MATRNVSLTDMLDQYVEERVRSGAFQNASEVVREGLRLLRKQEDEHAAKLARFLALVKEGDDAFAAGDFEEVGDLDAWFDTVEAELDAKPRKTREG